MSFSHGKDEDVFIHGYNVTAYLNAASIPQERETAETTVFKSTAKKKIAGLRDGSMSFEGYFDGSASAADAIFALVLAATSAIFEDWPAGDAVGASGYGMVGIHSSYEVTGSVGDAVGISVEAEANDGIERLISLHSIATLVTADGNGAIHDNGAATAAGGAAYLQMLTKTGGVSLDVTVRHSNDNFVGDDDLLATFTQNTASAGTERVAIVGAIKQYVRAVFDDDGTGGTWTLNVALHRA